MQVAHQSMSKMKEYGSLVLFTKDMQESTNVFPICKEVLIGRDKTTSDITVKVKTVSRTHVKICIDENGCCLIQNLSKTNPCVLNGNQLHLHSADSDSEPQVMLCDGDIFTLGDRSFKFILPIAIDDKKEDEEEEEEVTLNYTGSFKHKPTLDPIGEENSGSFSPLVAAMNQIDTNIPTPTPKSISKGNSSSTKKKEREENSRQGTSPISIPVPTLAPRTGIDKLSSPITVPASTASPLQGDYSLNMNSLTSTNTAIDTLVEVEVDAKVLAQEDMETETKRKSYGQGQGQGNQLRKPEHEHEHEHEQEQDEEEEKEPRQKRIAALKTPIREAIQLRRLSQGKAVLSSPMPISMPFINRDINGDVEKSRTTPPPIESTSTSVHLRQSLATPLRRAIETRVNMIYQTHTPVKPLQYINMNSKEQLLLQQVAEKKQEQEQDERDSHINRHATDDTIAHTHMPVSINNTILAAINSRRKSFSASTNADANDSAVGITLMRGKNTSTPSFSTLTPSKQSKQAIALSSSPTLAKKTTTPTLLNSQRNSVSTSSTSISSSSNGQSQSPFTSQTKQLATPLRHALEKRRKSYSESIKLKEQLLRIDDAGKFDVETVGIRAVEEEIGERHAHDVTAVSTPKKTRSSSSLSMTLTPPSNVLEGAIESLPVSIGKTHSKTKSTSNRKAGSSAMSTSRAMILLYAGSSDSQDNSNSSSNINAYNDDLDVEDIEMLVDTDSTYNANVITAACTHISINAMSSELQLHGIAETDANVQAKDAFSVNPELLRSRLSEGREKDNYGNGNDFEDKDATAFNIFDDIISPVKVNSHMGACIRTRKNAANVIAANTLTKRRFPISGTDSTNAKSNSTAAHTFTPIVVPNRHRNRQSLLNSLEKKGVDTSKSVHTGTSTGTSDKFVSETATATATAKDKHISLVSDLITTLTDDEMETINKYAVQLKNCSAIIDSDEAYALALDAYIRGVEQGNLISPFSPAPKKVQMEKMTTPTEKGKKMKVANERHAAATKSPGQLEGFPPLDFPERSIFTTETTSASTSVSVPVFVESTCTDIIDCEEAFESLLSVYGLPAGRASTADMVAVECYSQLIMDETREMEPQMDVAVAYGTALDSFLADPKEFRTRVRNLMKRRKDILESPFHHPANSYFKKYKLKYKQTFMEEVIVEHADMASIWMPADYSMNMNICHDEHTNIAASKEREASASASSCMSPVLNEVSKKSWSSTAAANANNDTFVSDINKKSDVRQQIALTYVTDAIRNVIDQLAVADTECISKSVAVNVKALTPTRSKANIHTPTLASKSTGKSASTSKGTKATVFQSQQQQQQQFAAMATATATRAINAVIDSLEEEEEEGQETSSSRSGIHMDNSFDGKGITSSHDNYNPFVTNIKYSLKTPTKKNNGSSQSQCISTSHVGSEVRSNIKSTGKSTSIGKKKEAVLLCAPSPAHAPASITKKLEVASVFVDQALRTVIHDLSRAAAFPDNIIKGKSSSSSSYSPSSNKQQQHARSTIAATSAMKRRDIAKSFVSKAMQNVLEDLTCASKKEKEQEREIQTEKTKNKVIVSSASTPKKMNFFSVNPSASPSLSPMLSNRLFTSSGSNVGFKVVISKSQKTSPVPASLNANENAKRVRKATPVKNNGAPTSSDAVAVSSIRIASPSVNIPKRTRTTTATATTTKETVVEIKPDVREQKQSSLISRAKRNATIAAVTAKAPSKRGKKAAAVAVAAVEIEEEEDAMAILCDGCDGEFFCDDVGLTEIPHGDWYCNACEKKKKKKDSATTTTKATGKKKTAVVKKTPTVKTAAATNKEKEVAAAAAAGPLRRSTRSK